MTQSELAVALEISPSRLCRYEKGNRLPSIAVLNKLKKLLGGNEEQSLFEVLQAS